MMQPDITKQWVNSLREFLEATAQLAKKILLLEVEGDQRQAKALVEPGIYVKGVRLWFLLASCLIACIGLNTNSSAVIIGAMLISPLMGPILGLGFGMATASRRMVRDSIKNLVFAVTITLITASLYFVVSPFQDPTAEILGRTAPNLLDLLVAVAAAFAGVVAMNSTSMAGAVPGVAIATSIMPPLCASAYGLAHGDWKVAVGAFYLFFVNAVAIAVVAFLLFKRMHFSEDVQESSENGRLKPAIISLAVILVVGPLVWSLWDAWRDQFVHRSVSRLVQSYRDRLEIVSWQWDGARSKKLVLYNFKKTTPDLRGELESQLKGILPGAQLELHESSLSPDMEEVVGQLKTSQLSSLLGNPKVVEGLLRLAKDENKESERAGAERGLMIRLLELEGELRALLTEAGQIRSYYRQDGGDSEILVLITANDRSSRRKMKQEAPRFQSWIKTRLQTGAAVRLEFL